MYVNSNFETIVVKNYSDPDTPNSHARISVHDDKSVHIVSDYGVTSLVSNTDLNGLKPGAVFEVGQYLDFHTAGSTADYDGRLYIDENTNDLIYRVGNVKYKLNTTVV